MEKILFRRIHGRIVPIRQKQSDLPAKALGVVAGLATYAVLRKFKVSSNPALARLQKETLKPGGLGALALGIPSHLKPVKAAMIGMKVNGPSRVYLNLMGVLPKMHIPIINDGKIIRSLHNKGKFMAVLRNSAKPKTMPLGQALKNGALPKGWIVKAKESAMTQAKNLRLTTRARNHPGKYIAQEKLNILNEYRVHVLNGEAFGLSHRYNPVKAIRSRMRGGGAFVPVLNPIKRKALKDFVRKNYPKLKGHSFAGLDIAETPKGFKFLEANPIPGTFNNPIVNRHFVRMATGRWGKDVSSLGAVGAGSIAYLGAKERRRGAK